MASCDIQLNEVVGCIADGKPFMDSILIHMGSLYTNLGMLDKASHAYERGLNILENAFGRGPYAFKVCNFS